MIVDVHVENYGPFKDRTCLSMLKLKGSELSENLFYSDAINGELLKSSIIFGPNASGKTWFIRAIQGIQLMVQSALLPNMQIMAYNPFRLSSDTIKMPTVFEIRFVSDNILFQYSLSFDERSIKAESLYYYPNKRKTTVFDRKDEEIDVNKKIPGLTNLTKMVNPNSTMLSVAAQLNNAVCVKAYNGLINGIIIVDDKNSALRNTILNMNQVPKIKKCINHAINMADLGITDVDGKIETQKLSEIISGLPPQIADQIKATGVPELERTELFMNHYTEDKDVPEQNKRFPAYLESTGTIDLLANMGPIMQALRSKETTVIIDEFGSSYHTDISKWIIGIFNEPTKNKNNAQLIVTSHDQGLMSEELFRRDQIYLTSKDSKTGSSELYAIADFNLRSGASVYKAYDAGRMGAKPFIEDGDLFDDQ